MLGPIRSLLGLGEASSVFSAAAPLPPDVAAFFAGLGMKILDVYGMTETTGAFTANTPTEFKLGTVGLPAAGMEVRIAEDGEILVRGPLTTPGYLSRPDLTERPHRCRRVAADRGHRHHRRGRVRVGDGPEEGTDHHRGRREHRTRRG